MNKIANVVQEGRFVKVYLNGALVAKSHDIKQDKSIYLSSSDSSSKYMISKILRPQFRSKTKFEK